MVFKSDNKLNSTTEKYKSCFEELYLIFLTLKTTVQFEVALILQNVCVLRLIVYRISKNTIS